MTMTHVRRVALVAAAGIALLAGTDGATGTAQAHRGAPWMEEDVAYEHVSAAYPYDFLCSGQGAFRVRYGALVFRHFECMVFDVNGPWTEAYRGKWCLHTRRPNRVAVGARIGPNSYRSCFR